MSTYKIPKTQTVALARRLGGPVEFVHDYPVKMPGRDEVLAKVLYTGVCQSGSWYPKPEYHFDLHTPSTNHNQTSTPLPAPPPAQMAPP